jgi:hypothetical protein
MKRIGWYLILLICLLGYQVHAVAQHISVSAPSHVAAGENFRVAYTINTRDVEEFRMGAVQDGLEVIAGPYTSSQSSYQMINGHTSSSSSVTITYTLYAAKNGTFNIGASHAVVGGRSLASHAVRITVSGHAQHTNGAPSMHGQNSYDQPRMRTAGSAISGSDLFIKVSANKKRVHEQEPILLTYKVYTQVELTQLEGKMPDLKGFHNQEVPLPQQKTFHTEMVNGRPYKCVTWSQYVMYPQMTGKLEIPSITFKGIVVQQNRNVDPMEAFFNGGSGYVEVKKDIKAPGITLQVDPLPQRPANFSGGVGKFNISACLDKKEIKAGEPITLRVIVGGIGNLKLLKQPVVNFPKDFDKYDAKVTDKTRLTANGVEGNMIYDFLAVPRNQGKIITGLIVLWIASQRHLVVFDGLCIFTVVLHDHTHVVIAGSTAEAVGFQLGSISKLLYRHGVFLLRHERTTKIVYRLWILLIFGDSLAILCFCHCPFLRFEGTIALTDQVAISLGSGLCRTHQQHCHCYYYIMYILHFYIYILKLLPFQGALLLLVLPRAMPWAKSFCPFRANR